MLGPPPARSPSAPPIAPPTPSAHSPSGLLSEDCDQVLQAAHVLAHCPAAALCHPHFRAEGIEGKRGRNRKSRLVGDSPSAFCPCYRCFSILGSWLWSVNQCRSDPQATE